MEKSEDKYIKLFGSIAPLHLSEDGFGKMVTVHRFMVHGSWFTGYKEWEFVSSWK